MITGSICRALLGQDAGAAIAHFRGKLTAADDGEADPALPAQTLVNLLRPRWGRWMTRSTWRRSTWRVFPNRRLACPGVAQLCLRAGQPERLARIARDQGDLVTFTAALLQSQAGEQED